VNDETLHIAEIPYESGQLKYVYSRYLADDGKRWVRHGLFRAFHPNGKPKSEGEYEHGIENGSWRDFHENGQLAAEGAYRNGKTDGRWRFWDQDGREEKPVDFKDGVEVGTSG
jgi:antitoxin component YwqK of YwqJK toxin-antitoxin module